MTGGRNEFQVPVGSIIQFDGERSCLGKITLPVTRYDHMAAQLNQFLLICGGHVGMAQSVAKSCDKFDLDKKVWSKIEDMPNKLRDAAAVPWKNEKVSYEI